MNFKKDYINYVLHNVLQADNAGNAAAQKVLERIIEMDDFFKITFIIGKTAGLELLFKYLLYISDKVDKSQITIFNLKDNFDYDVNNLRRIFNKLQIKDIPQAQVIEEINMNGNDKPYYKETEKKEVIHIDADENIKPDEEIKETIKEYEEVTAEAETEDSGMSLIENNEPESTVSSEVFDLESISRSIETGDPYNDEILPAGTQTEDDKKDDYEEETIEEDTVIQEESSFPIEQAAEEAEEETPEEKIIEEQELEIEVRKHDESEDEVTEQLEMSDIPNTEDEFNKFEHKYYEEIKILEKLFSYIEKECRYNSYKGINERTIQTFNEIIEISDGLASLTRQLSFDLIADIFLTLNMYFTKAVKDPSIISLERIKLFDSSLEIVSSLIKGENYMDYDEIIAKVQALKEFLSQPALIEGEKVSSIASKNDEQQEEKHPLRNLSERTAVFPEPRLRDPEDALIEKPKVKKASADSIIFKMKYLVKEFEKNFTALERITGEYSKFTALEKIDELNSNLRMLAKISAAVKLTDILKLAEVSYVFLKYLKDYRMDLMDSEIQQIIKYIIFTFKMLLTDRKPEDFNVLVQYLNNPVKIFADSN